MKTPPRQLRAFAMVGVLAVSILGYLAYESLRPLPTTPSDAPSRQIPIPQTNLSAVAPSVKFDPLPETLSAPSSITSRGQETEADRVVMADTLRNIGESLGKVELRGAKILDERKHTEGYGHSKMIEIPPIPREAVEEAYAELGRGLKALSNNSPITEKLKRRAFEKIESFTKRPKPFLSLLVSVQDEAAEKIYLVAFYVDDLKTVARDSRGILSIREGFGPDEVLTASGYYKKGDGWAYERFAHFFETP